MTSPFVVRSINVTLYKAGSKEDLFWQMVDDLLRLDQKQSDRLSEKMLWLDVEDYMKDAK